MKILKIFLIATVLSSFITIDLNAQAVSIGQPLKFKKKYTKKKLWDELNRNVFGDFTASSGVVKNINVWNSSWQAIYSVSVDKDWNRLIFMNRNDNWFDAYGSAGHGKDEFYYPHSVVMYSKDPNSLNSNGDVYVADTYNARIVKLLFNFADKSISWVTSFNNLPGPPMDVAYSNNLTPSNLSDDVLWVMFEHKILKIDPASGNILDEYTGYSDGLNGNVFQNFGALNGISTVQDRYGNTYNDELYVIDTFFKKQPGKRGLIYLFEQSPSFLYSTQYYTFPTKHVLYDVKANCDNTVYVLLRSPNKIVKFNIGQIEPLTEFHMSTGKVYDPRKMENISGYLPISFMEDWHKPKNYKYGLSEYRPTVQIKDFDVSVDANWNIWLIGTSVTKATFHGTFNGSNSFSDDYGDVGYFQYKYGQLPSSLRNSYVNLNITFDSFDLDFSGSPVSTVSTTKTFYYSHTPPTLTLNISGPSLLSSGTQGTFTGNASGGSGTYTDYQWWERNDGSGGPNSPAIKPGDPVIDAPNPGTWLEITSVRGQKTIQRGHPWDFSLKCEVTDSQGGKASDIHSVVVSGNISFGANPNDIPKELVLNSNYPNPFNPITTIKFGLPKDGRIKLLVYSSTGQLVNTLFNGFMQKGYHQVQWDGKNSRQTMVASGIYIYELRAGNKRILRKMLFAK